MLPKALATVRRPLEQLCAYLFIRSLYPREDPANSLYGVDVSCLPPSEQRLDVQPFACFSTQPQSLEACVGETRWVIAL